jgi:hypothetical protein
MMTVLEAASTISGKLKVIRGTDETLFDSDRDGYDMPPDVAALPVVYVWEAHGETTIYC